MGYREYGRVCRCLITENSDYQLLSSPVDETVDIMLENGVDLLLHLFLLGHFDLGDFGHRVDSDPGSEHFDLVRVHGSVGQKNLGILYSLGLAHTYAFLQNETWTKKKYTNSDSLPCWIHGFMYFPIQLADIR